MRQHGVWHHLATAVHGVERAAEASGVPQHCGGDDQGEPAHATLLRLYGPVAAGRAARPGIPGPALVEFRYCLSPELWFCAARRALAGEATTDGVFSQRQSETSLPKKAGLLRQALSGVCKGRPIRERNH
jgi:hypothetical protein